MARIRYLKPDFFKDEHLAELSYEVRLCFAGLWSIADKAGRLEDRPLRIKAEIFPYDKVDINKCLSELSKPKNGSGRPFIIRYVVNNESYIQIFNWDKHQKPHHTEKDSKIPSVPQVIQDQIQKNIEKGIGMGMGSVMQASTGLRNGEVTVKEPLYISETKEIVFDFNDVFGTSYKPSSKQIVDLIGARLKDGFGVEDFKAVHRKMLKAWGADQKMCKYLRPITLYSTKFESYLNQKEASTKLTETGIKAYLIGQEWLKKQEAADAKQG